MFPHFTSLSSTNQNYPIIYSSPSLPCLPSHSPIHNRKKDNSSFPPSLSSSWTRSGTHACTAPCSPLLPLRTLGTMTISGCSYSAYSFSSSFPGFLSSETASFSSFLMLIGQLPMRVFHQIRFNNRLDRAQIMKIQAQNYSAPLLMI